MVIEIRIQQIDHLERGELVEAALPALQRHVLLHRPASRILATTRLQNPSGASIQGTSHQEDVALSAHPHPQDDQPTTEAISQLHEVHRRKEGGESLIKLGAIRSSQKLPLLLALKVS